jgi:hypothetical protein
MKNSNIHQSNLEIGVMVSKWFKIEKSSWGLSAAIVILDKVVLYAGKTDHWGIGANINFYDRSLTFEVLNLYTGIEILHSQDKNEL